MLCQHSESFVLSELSSSEDRSEAVVGRLVSGQREVGEEEAEDQVGASLGSHKHQAQSSHVRPARVSVLPGTLDVGVGPQPGDEAVHQARLVVDAGDGELSHIPVVVPASSVVRDPGVRLDNSPHPPPHLLVVSAELRVLAQGSTEVLIVEVIEDHHVEVFHLEMKTVVVRSCGRPDPTWTRDMKSHRLMAAWTPWCL